MGKKISRSQRRGKAAITLALILLLAFSIWSWEPGAAFAEEPSPQATPSASPVLSDTDADDLSETEFAEITVPTEESDEAITWVDGLPCVVGEVLVQFSENASDAEVQSAMSALDTQNLEEIKDNLHVAEVPEGETIADYIDTLEKEPDVLYAQPNYVYYLTDTDNVVTLDESTEDNRGPEGTANDSYLGYQWYLDTIGAYSAWDTTMGNSGVRVAVIDTGADLNHPDLTGRILYQTDVVDNDGNANDDEGHGTHVAGTIAATANNGIGVAGVAPGVSLIVVDAFNTNGIEWWATSASVVSGINYARSKGANVINLSLGSYGLDIAEQTALDAAVSAGVVVVAAAGNDSTSTIHYPSDLDSVISVTATDIYDAFASYSNYGPQKDISAPGGDGYYADNEQPVGWILSTYIDGYAWMAGTSMAAPVVSGVVALMLSSNYSLSVNDVKDYLYNSATDLGSTGRDQFFGYGRVDAYLAVDTVPAIWSSRYAIDRRGSYLTGVADGTSIGTLKSFLTSDNGLIKVYNTSGQEVTSGNVATGMRVKLMDGATVLDNLAVVIKGDVNGDGRITVSDYALVRLHILGLKTASGAYLEACDVNDNGSVNVMDYTDIRLDILGSQRVN